MITALKPFYNRIYIKLDSDCVDCVYEFIYKTSLKNDETFIILDKYDLKFVTEVSLFKDTIINIEITSDNDIINNSYNCFCNSKCLPNIKYRPIGVYHDFSIKYRPIIETDLFNIDETFVRNDLNNIISNLAQTKDLDVYQEYLLEELEPINNIRSSFDEYLFKNRNSLFLDNVGNFYSDITFKDKLGNITTDNIEVSIIRHLERGVYND